MAEKAGAGPEKQPLQFRTSPAFQWRGLNPDVEPQDLPPDVPRQLTNMRLVGGRIESRGGQQLIQDLETAVMGMTDYRPGPEKLMIGAHQHDEVLLSYSPEQSPVVQTEIEIVHGSQYDSAFVEYNGEFYFSHNYHGYGTAPVGVYKLRNGNVPYGLTSADFSAGEQAIVVWELPSPYILATAMAVFDGELYVAVSNTLSTAVAIYKYDGTTFVLDLDTSAVTSQITAFGVFRETLIAFYYGDSSVAATNIIRVRTNTGVWSTISAPVPGTPVQQGAWGSNRTRSYRDRLYYNSSFQSGNSPLWMFNGSVITDVSAAAGIGANGSVTAIEVAYGYLYYFWTDTSTAECFVGRYDGTTWTANHKDLTAYLSPDVPFTVNSVVLFKGNLCAIMWGTFTIGVAPTANIAVILESVGSDTDGDWSIIPLTPPLPSWAEINSALVF